MSERSGTRGGDGADAPGGEARVGSGEPASEPEPLTRLDPYRAAATAPEGAAPEAAETAPQPRSTLAPPVADARRYRWMIGIFGLGVVIAVSVYQFAANGVGTTGVPAGKPLRYFSAPLANTNLSGIANANPPCTLARHDPRVLNVCLIARSSPLVLSLFSTASSQCERQVDALQQLSHRYPASRVQFAAVAVNGSQSATAALIRSHHWTIPVAYDSGNVVGGLYDVAVCPMAELAKRGGIVKYRLIGDAWETRAALAPKVQALLDSQPPAR